MTKLNPYTNKPTRFVTQEEVEAIRIDNKFGVRTYNQIDEQIRCSFEFATQFLVRSHESLLIPNKASLFDDLKNRIRTTMTQRQTSRSGSLNLSRMLMMQRGWKETKT